ncbi:S-layer homology domain-containing protein [Cohnella faecalis]|uniref:S-layer homology domain-containing protein n=1 Tax=Cohnella faecalis TaxID=2315694 RepID=A0A398CUK7_9BACL|nr:S-layer homology domain-containing protein [Cohnella faecalis]RIE04328.1 S-layer homology domain-containing protein [Cohnella faecalis]
MNTWKRKSITLTLLVSLLCLTLSGSVYAFNDVKGEPESAAITKLEQRGILKGNGSGLFHPKQTLNAASAVSLIVRGLELNIDNLRFFKEPLASDYYTKVNDKAWYAGSFIIAQFNGLGLPKDIDPNAIVTREQFAKWLFGALSTKGDYAWIEIFLEVADADAVTDGYMDSIQKLLIAKIAVLDGKQAFRPKQPITRAEAAGMVARTIDFINDKKNTPVQPPVSYDVKLASEKVGTEAQRVTLTTTVGHPGYGFEISSVDFRDGKAYVNYRIVQPDPDRMYPQVLTEVKATTIISSDLTPVLGSDESGYSVSGSQPSDGSGAAGSTGFPIE